MVELTSGLTLIVPLMVSAFTAKLFGEFLNSGGIYDAHIELNSFPFLSNKDSYKFSARAIDTMKPQWVPDWIKAVSRTFNIFNFRKNEAPLVTLTKDEMTVREIELLLQRSELNGYPIVVTKESQCLYGYIWKRDLKMALDQYRCFELIDDLTVVEFSFPNKTEINQNSVNLFKLVDIVSKNFDKVLYIIM